jgi:hypothetical protein
MASNLQGSNMSSATINDPSVPNPVIRRTPLSFYPWVVEEHKDGTFYGYKINSLATTPGLDSFRAVVSFIRDEA